MLRLVKDLDLIKAQGGIDPRPRLGGYFGALRDGLGEKFL
jgi:hypothetical protein